MLSVWKWAEAGETVLWGEVNAEGGLIVLKTVFNDRDLKYKTHLFFDSAIGKKFNTYFCLLQQ